MPIRRTQSPVSLVVATDHRGCTDAELAKALVVGNSWATTEAWYRFAPMVLVMATRALGSESEAEDVAQEVFQRVYRKARTLREPERLRSFVFSFAVHVVKSELRRRRAFSWLSFRQPDAFVDWGGESLDVESRDLLRRFYGLLDRLKPRDRLVFALRHLERMTVEEIAVSMELSESTAKRSLTQATSRLSRWIADEPDLASLFHGKGWNR